jgi:prophage antirepressor-like protein
MREGFIHTNDVDKTLRVFNEHSFYAIQIDGMTFSSMTIRKETAEKLRDWLIENLEESE